MSPADLDGDHITDYVYAGDLKGNVWRFDLTSNIETSCRPHRHLLFTVPAGSPITTKLQLAIIPATSSSAQRMMVDFGTGQKTPQTNLTPAQYATGFQHIYGIWDWNMTGWNANMKAPATSSRAATNHHQRAIAIAIADLQPGGSDARRDQQSGLLERLNHLPWRFWRGIRQFRLQGASARHQ